ncbi:CHAT domain-containing protein [Actinophytocola sediminis]
MRRADFEPAKAVPFAARVAARAVREGDLAAAAVAERAWGRASLQTKHVDRAIEHLRRSIAHAQRIGNAELAGEARIPLSAALLQRGRPRQALREIDIAVRDLNGDGHARARGQRADLLRQIGRLDAGLTEFQVAIPLLRATTDLVSLQRTLVNRGILHTERHEFTSAEADLREADRLAKQLGRHLAVGIIAENLGYLETLRGDVPAALAHLDRAEQIIGALGGQLGPVYSDQCELLLSAGVPAEAQLVAHRAIRAFERQRRRLMVPGARLFLAQAAFADGDVPAALAHARRARREFARQHRTEWAALAHLVVVRAELATPAGTRITTSALTAMVDTLVAAGWPAAALEARLVAARISGPRGRTAERGAHLALAAEARRGGPATLRARGWYAEALTRAGDDRGVARAVRAGLRVLDEHAAALGATDLRVHSATHRAELSELGLRLALRRGRAGGVLEWAERGRAGRFMHRAVLPAEDPVLADLLAQLRATAAEIDRGRGGLMARRVALERRIRHHCRLHPPQSGGQPGEPVRAGTLGDALGSRALVEFAQLNGTLYAVTMVDRRMRLRQLGSAEVAGGLVERMPFALQRLVRGAGASCSAAGTLLADAARRLDEVLLAPLPELAGRPLVVVPTGALHCVPWSVLPSCADRPVTVSPSATLWHTASSEPIIPRGRVMAAAGPGLSGARAEAAVVAAIHGRTALLDGAATADAVLAELATADIAHLAAHGDLAPDNPLFSRLRLHDGPLVTYDIERLPRVPHTVVLASCDSGRSLVCTGDELLGLSAAFIAKGAAQLVASVVPIPDLETAPLMVELHRGLAAGLSAPVALSLAQREIRDRGPADLAAAAGFVSLGGERDTFAPRPAQSLVAAATGRPTVAEHW